MQIVTDLEPEIEKKNKTSRPRRTSMSLYPTSEEVMAAFPRPNVPYIKHIAEEIVKNGSFRGTSMSREGIISCLRLMAEEATMAANNLAKAAI